MKSPPLFNKPAYNVYQDGFSDINGNRVLEVLTIYGSSTLVIDGRVMNISPYNSKYEENIYSLPPEPRAVSNAVIGYTE